jgi:hypothetical protein
MFVFVFKKKLIYFQVKNIYTKSPYNVLLNTSLDNVKMKSLI